MSIELKEVPPPNSTFVIYDMQSVGNLQYTNSCFTWNLSAMIFEQEVTGKPHNMFDQFVQLPMAEIPPVEHHKLFQVTHEFLVEANAQPMPTVLDYFFKWISNVHKGGSLFLVSHGNFRNDKNVLEQEMLRYKIPFPIGTHFLDTLWMFRLKLPDLGTYSLKSLYQNAKNKQLQKAHLSLFNVYAVNDILHHYFKENEFNFSGICYGPFYTPLTRIPSVGMFTEKVLFDKEIYCAESLIQLFQERFRGNIILFQNHLKDELHVTQSAIAQITTHVQTAYY